MNPNIISTFTLHFTLIFLSFSRVIFGAATFVLTNRCSYTVWPGTLSNEGSPALESTGFELPPRGSRSLVAPQNWSGRIWGRSGCTSNETTGQFTCLTGDCSSNQVECNGNNASPPATLVEFTIGSGMTQDYYDVSLVDGYNLPMIVEPNGRSGSCLTTGCVSDINQNCPAELRAELGYACKSACEAFGIPEYCCSGEYANPNTCKPSVYSEMFKAACPRSYSYAYDDATSTFTCSGADYLITFCPSVASQKSARDTSTAPSTTPNGSGSGSSEVPIGTNSPWLQSIINGGSPSSLAFSAWKSLIVAFTISFLHYPFVASAFGNHSCN